MIPIYWHKHLISCGAVNHGGQATCSFKQGHKGDDDYDDDKHLAWVKDWRRFTDQTQKESHGAAARDRIGAYGSGDHHGHVGGDEVATGASAAAGPFRRRGGALRVAGAATGTASSASPTAVCA